MTDKTIKQNICLNDKSTLQDVLKHFDSKAALSDVLGISKQAVSQMNMDSPLSRLHYMTLRHEKRSHLYLPREPAA